jgi:hypothetical protein
MIFGRNPSLESWRQPWHLSLDPNCEWKLYWTRLHFLKCCPENSINFAQDGITHRRTRTPVLYRRHLTHWAILGNRYAYPAQGCQTDRAVKQFPFYLFFGSDVPRTFRSDSKKDLIRYKTGPQLLSGKIKMAIRRLASFQTDSSPSWHIYPIISSVGFFFTNLITFYFHSSPFLFVQISVHVESYQTLKMWFDLTCIRFDSTWGKTCDSLTKNDSVSIRLDSPDLPTSSVVTRIRLSKPPQSKSLFIRTSPTRWERHKQKTWSNACILPGVRYA